MEKNAPIPVLITAYKDRTFKFVTKLPPVSHYLKKAAKIDKGSSTPGRELVGKVTMKDVAKEPAVSALFTGDVSRQNVLDPNDSSNFNFGIVSFSAGSRNKFHKHSGDQILIITEGTGTVATDDESITVHQGDVVVIPAGENHWHGAPDATAMAHITVTVKGSQTEQTEA